MDVEYDLVVYLTSKHLKDQDLESIQYVIDELQSNLDRAFEIREDLKNEDYGWEKYD